MEMICPVNKPQFMIAAPTSGAGKTTVSRGLMALLVKRGWKVQPFKCGPDYIDTKYHAAVCGRPSINLDTFMASEAHVKKLYAGYGRSAGACLVEGMMGMFDGYDRDRGSSADIARVLDLPVVLVVDAKSAAYSMAPLLLGFTGFRPDVRIAGVIFNRVGSSRHADMLRQVCDDLHLTCFGYLPKEPLLERPSRYLGLDFSKPESREALDTLVGLLERHVDIDRLIEETDRPFPEYVTEAARGDKPCSSGINDKDAPLILVARNEESFSFIYEEHLDMLRRMGRVSFFNPEQAFTIPEGTKLLYLPGGYPERHARALAGAAGTMASIKEYIEHGGKTLAECGGMVYLTRGICMEGEDGESFLPMARVLPFAVSNLPAHRRLHLGYRAFTYNGLQLRGHEFHYTRLLPAEASLPPSAAKVYNAKGDAVDTPVFHYKNLLAGYTHLYWGETDVWRLFD